MNQVAKPSFPAFSDSIVDPVKGRGYGKFVEGEPITEVSQVNVGDLLCEYSIQFNACNLVRVTKTDYSDTAVPDHTGIMFYGIIVDPKDPSKTGMGVQTEHCFWNWEFNPIHRETGQLGQTFNVVLHRATMSHEPQRRLELQASDFKTAVEASSTPEGRKMLEWFAARNGPRFMLDGTNPVARIIEIEQRKPGFVPLMVEHRIV